MKMITLWQPWASLMAIGVKKIETRSWLTHYRGPLAIHAAKRRIMIDKDSIDAFTAHDIDHAALPYGQILAVGILVDCIQMTEGNVLTVPTGNEILYGHYEVGRYMWVTENMKAIEPIPYRGQQGIYTIPEELASKITA